MPNFDKSVKNLIGFSILLMVFTSSLSAFAGGRTSCNYSKIGRDSEGLLLGFTKTMSVRRGTTSYLECIASNKFQEVTDEARKLLIDQNEVTRTFSCVESPAGKEFIVIRSDGSLEELVTGGESIDWYSDYYRENSFRSESIRRPIKSQDWNCDGTPSLREINRSSGG